MKLTWTKTPYRKVYVWEHGFYTIEERRGAWQGLRSPSVAPSGD